MLSYKNFTKWVLCLITCMYAWTFMPYSYTVGFRIPLLNFPYINGIWFVVTSLCLFFLLNRRIICTKLFFLYTLGVLYVSIVGLFNTDSTYFKWYYYFQDLSIIIAVLVGIIFAENCDFKTYIKWIIGIFYIATSMLWFSIMQLNEWSVGLLFRQFNDGSRLLDLAQYNSSYFILTYAILIWFIRPEKYDKKYSESNRNIVITGLVGCFVFALQSGTRSLIISFFIFLCVFAFISINRSKARIYGFFLLNLVILCFIYFITLYRDFFDGDKVWGGYELLVSRFNQLREPFTEPRLHELKLLYDQMTLSEMFFGKGIGVGFISPVGEDGDLLINDVLYPHVGLIAPFQKGGVFIMFFFMIPLIFSIRNTIHSADKIKLSLKFGILFYFIQASMSGGWYFTGFFILGTLLVYSKKNRICHYNNYSKRE
jgi:hypothetical protein